MVLPLPEVLAGGLGAAGWVWGGYGVVFRASPFPGDAAQPRQLILIGSGLFLLPDMQTAPGVQAGCAQPSPVTTCWRGLSAVPSPCRVSQNPSCWQGRAGQGPVLAVEGWDGGTAQTQLWLPALPGLAVPRRS